MLNCASVAASLSKMKFLIRDLLLYLCKYLENLLKVVKMLRLSRNSPLGVSVSAYRSVSNFH